MTWLLFGALFVATVLAYTMGYGQGRLDERYKKINQDEQQDRINNSGASAPLTAGGRGDASGRPVVARHKVKPRPLRSEPPAAPPDA